MNTHDQAGALEDKPRLLLCDDCNKDFLSRNGKTICAECGWKRDQKRLAAQKIGPRFDDDFTRIFATGRKL